MGRLRRNICEFDVHRDENVPDMREAVEPATRADPVTVIRCDRMRVLEDGLLRRRDSEGNAITQIAMWRIRCEPEQQRAE
jgi:predicted N-acetyltransferase YhbS